MLNLYVRSMKLRLFSLLALILVAAQASPPVAITSPMPDEVLRGQVSIMGKVDVPSFVSAQLDFAYASNPTNTWFTIQAFSQPPVDSTLATWDTTSITDGDYILRLQVNLEDGTSQEVTVPVKIGNDALPTPHPRTHLDTSTGCRPHPHPVSAGGLGYTYRGTASDADGPPDQPCCAWAKPNLCQSWAGRLGYPWIVRRRRNYSSRSPLLNLNREIWNYLTHDP